MKKLTRLTALLLALTLTLSFTALAEDAKTENDKATIKNVLTGATVTFDETVDEKILVTYTSEDLVPGSFYLVMMVSSDAQGNYGAITKDNLTYIDQVTADESKSISFTVYPSKLTTSVILITSAEGTLKAAIVEAKYILGDVDGSGEVDVGDVTALLRYVVGLSTASDITEPAADVDGSGEVDVGDVTKLLRVVVGLEML